jgi:hypothetical protein
LGGGLSRAAGFGLSYRYAYFSGNDPDSSKSEDFDPLFYGLYESDPGGENEQVEWGTWIQGEIIGEFVLLNSNLKTHTVRLRAYPLDELWFNLIYYRFLLDRPEDLDPGELCLSRCPAQIQRRSELHRLGVQRRPLPGESRGKPVVFKPILRL